MKPSEFVEAVIDRIETKGWHQGSFFSERDPGVPNDLPACLVGSMSDVSARNNFVVDAWNSVVLSIYSRIGNQKSFPRWNDEPGRTKEEVIDMLTEVAKDFRNRGE